MNNEDFTSAVFGEEFSNFWERNEQAINGVIIGVAAVAVGVIVIVASGGTAAPLVIGLACAGTALGVVGIGLGSASIGVRESGGNTVVADQLGGASYWTSQAGLFLSTAAAGGLSGGPKSSGVSGVKNFGLRRSASWEAMQEGTFVQGRTVRLHGARGITFTKTGPTRGSELAGRLNLQSAPLNTQTIHLQSCYGGYGGRFASQAQVLSNTTGRAVKAVPGKWNQAKYGNSPELYTTFKPQGRLMSNVSRRLNHILGSRTLNKLYRSHPNWR